MSRLVAFLVVVFAVVLVGTHPSETALVAEGTIRVVASIAVLWIAGVAVVVLVAFVVFLLLMIAELVDRIGRSLR